MNTYAQILCGKAHWIFQSTETIDQLKKRFSSDCVFADITNLTPQPQEGWFFDGSAFSPDDPAWSLADAQVAKLAGLNAAAAAAYVAGFYSSASGTQLWYDSDTDTQNVINRQYLIALSAPGDYSATQFFPGVPVGVTPVRARLHPTDPDSAKTIQLLNAAQMVQLGNDLAAAWAAVKGTLWSLQAKVYVAMTKADLDAITWPASS